MVSFIMRNVNSPFKPPSIGLHFIFFLERQRNVLHIIKTYYNKSILKKNSWFLIPHVIEFAKIMSKIEVYCFSIW